MYRVRPYFSSYRVGRDLSCRVLVSMFSSKTGRLDPVKYFIKRVRIFGDAEASMAPILVEWNRKTRSITREQGLMLIHELEESNRINHAYELYQWMNERLKFPLTQDYATVGINLIFKVKGPDHAEKFFNSISSDLKGMNAYRALLRVYVAEKSVKKAEDVVRQMKTLGSTKSPYFYNALIGLYSRTGNIHKIEGKISEMEEGGILRNSRTLKHHMLACVSSSDTSTMEKILIHIKNNPSLAHWEIYALAATLHVKSGFNESALALLKESEINIPDQERGASIGYLIPLYALTGKKDEVYRIWNQHAEKLKGFAKYAIMIHSLIVLGDLEEAERLFWEWDEQTNMEDGNNALVLKPLIAFYCERGLVKKAKSVLSKAIAEGRGSESYVRCWEVIAMMHINANEMRKGIVMMKRAFGGGVSPSWKPSAVIMRWCFSYLMIKQNLSVMNEFAGLIEKFGPLTMDLYRCLLSVHLVAGVNVSGILWRMKRDGMDMMEARRLVRSKSRFHTRLRKMHKRDSFDNEKDARNDL